MIHKWCRERGHNWDNWRWMPADADGCEARFFDDIYTLPNGMAAGVFFYKRACQNSGCDAVQRAKDLIPVEQKIFDTKASEAASEQERQILSFAYGNARIENDRITKPLVERIAREKLSELGYPSPYLSRREHLRHAWWGLRNFFRHFGHSLQ